MTHELGHERQEESLAPEKRSSEHIDLFMLTKRIKKQDSMNMFQIQDLQNAGEEAKNEYIQSLNGIVGDFLANFSSHFEYCKLRMHQVHALNPRTTKENGTLINVTASNGLKFPDNNAIIESLSLLRSKAHDLVAIFDCIQDWILAHIPQIKEEDNSGVEVQETVVTQIAGYYKVVKGIYSEEMEYLARRAELETSYLKQPASDSWMRAIVLHDIQEWDDIENCWRALIRVIMLGQNLLMRNIEKLKEPRSAQRGMHI
ncbi:proteasome activator complex subunit 3 [Perkinsela sp. CCAP 1560/4]|nr:proteasome activator complex subunit 3 [Perkinsela sp. CCAP 1560/4]|eukprot:KNH09518.1 proteasome activator complex subunit 3 [Perkinsela sp. CCAP 1560/4]